jgi:hypothetical protein
MGYSVIPVVSLHPSHSQPKVQEKSREEYSVDKDWYQQLWVELNWSVEKPNLMISSRNFQRAKSTSLFCYKWSLFCAWIFEINSHSSYSIYCISLKVVEVVPEYLYGVGQELWQKYDLISYSSISGCFMKLSLCLSWGYWWYSMTSQGPYPVHLA